jgi:hypothetical protein
MLLMVCRIEAKSPSMVDNRMPSYPYISGDGFRSMADHVYDETDQSLQASEIALGDIVFVKTDKLGVFFNTIHPEVQYPYILVSHNADHAAPAEHESYLEDEKILKWFGQNPTIMHHPKFVPIPIGIANRYVGDHGNINNLKGFSLGLRSPKSCLLGYNFEPGSNRTERGPVHDMFVYQHYVKNLLGWPHRKYVTRMSEAKFILSPRGNGLDCHRTWEALIVGTIPILKTSMLDELLEGLPVLIVDDWSEINEQFLEQSYVEINKKFDVEHLEKLTYAYWKRLLVDYQHEIRMSNP